MTKRKKSTDEVKEVAEMIASVVVAEPVESSKVTKQEEVKVVVVEQPKEKVKAVPVAKAAPTKNVKIKATASVRGVFNNLRYEIVAGEVYTFPQALAELLISQGRAI